MIKNIFLLLLGIVLDLLFKIIVPALLIKIAIYGIFDLSVSMWYYVLVFLALRLLIYDYKGK